MRDLTLFIILAGLVGTALYRPWLGVLGLTVLSFLHPQAWGDELTRWFPMYKTLFAAVVLSTAYAAWRRPQELQLPPRDWRLYLIAALWLYFLLTSLQAPASWYSVPAFFDFSKSLAVLALALLLINTGYKALCLIAATSLCIGLVAAKGGYWAIMSGFTDRVYGPPFTQYGDNNHFAIAAVVNIPLLWLMFSASSSRALRGVLATIIALSILAVLSSWSRGALLALGATLSVLLLLSPKRLLTIPALALFIGFAALEMPDAWRERMASIAGPQNTAEQHDESAQNRLRVWRIGIEQGLEHPLVGGGFDSWRHATLRKEHRAWHSAYIQILADHGVVAFTLWAALLFGSIAVPAWHGISRPRHSHTDSTTSAGGFLAASLTGYAVGAAFLSAAYWALPFHIIVLGVLLDHSAECQDFLQSQKRPTRLKFH